jgi:hypothetical protein
MHSKLLSKIFIDISAKTVSTDIIFYIFKLMSILHFVRLFLLISFNKEIKKYLTSKFCGLGLCSQFFEKLLPSLVIRPKLAWIILLGNQLFIKYLLS